MHLDNVYRPPPFPDIDKVSGLALYAVTFVVPAGVLFLLLVKPSFALRDRLLSLNLGSRRADRQMRDSRVSADL